MPQIPLSGSVGQGGTNNAADVTQVQQRLNDLGLSWIAADGAIGPITIKAIKLFQSIKNGSETVGGDGRVDVNGDTHGWLEADNAPQWLTLPASGTGYINIEVSHQPTDHHDFGTDWLSETITAAGDKYNTDFLDSRSVSLLTVNDASKPQGGDTSDHAGHETGLSCDLRLPVSQAAGSAPAAAPAGTVSSAGYSQDAARAVLQAFHAQPLFHRALLNDQVLKDEGLCALATGHDNHIHVEIKPPPRQ